MGNHSNLLATKAIARTGSNIPDQLVVKPFSPRDHGITKSPKDFS